MPSSLKVFESGARTSKLFKIEFSFGGLVTMDGFWEQNHFLLTLVIYIANGSRCSMV